MTRGFGLFLLALGIVISVVGAIGTVAAIGQLRQGAGLLTVFLLVDLVGALILLGAIRTLRKAKPLGTSLGGLPTDHFPANTATPHDLDGVAYTRLFTPPVKGKNARPSVLTFSTRVDTAGEFEMVVESWFDRMCKNWGIAEEVQTGDAKFDEECYVRSDTPAFAEAYLADSLKRTAILNLREFGFYHVILKDGTLSAKRTGFDPSADDRPGFSEEVAARLVLLTRNLPPPQPEFETRTGANRKKWQAIFWVLLVAFALLALSLVKYPPVHTTELLSRAAVLLLFWPLFAYLSAWLLSGTSRSHLAWGALMFGSLFLFPLGASGTIALFNGALDQSQEITHRAVIVEKYTSRSKNRTNYHVRCQAWGPGGGTLSYGVSWAEYKAVVLNQSKVVVVTRAGRLGVEWEKSHRVDP